MCRVRVWVQAQVRGRGTPRRCFCGLYCRPGWWVVVPLGWWLGLCQGRWMAPPGRCPGCRRSLGTGALGGVVGAGAGAEGPGVGGVRRGSGACLCGGAFGWRVSGVLCRPDWCAVAWAAHQVGLCRRCLAGCRLAAVCGRVGWCLGSWSWVACGASGWAHLRVCGAKVLFRFRCLLPPYSWGLARLCSWQVTPGVPVPL